MELHKLAKLIDTKGNKLFKNVKTRWILMSFPTKRVFVEYRPLNVKMDVESSKSDTILKYLNVLWYWIHYWASIYPSNAWMCACIDQICIEQRCVCVWFCEVCQIGPTRIYQLYCDLYAKYEDLVYNEFNSIQVLPVIPFLLVSFLIWMMERTLYTLCFHLLTINTLFTNPMLMVVEKNNLSPKMSLTKP